MSDDEQQLEMIHVFAALVAMHAGIQKMPINHDTGTKGGKEEYVPAAWKWADVFLQEYKIRYRGKQ